MKPLLLNTLVVLLLTEAFTSAASLVPSFQFSFALQQTRRHSTCVYFLLNLYAKKFPKSVQSSAMGIGAMATTMNLNKKKKEV
jgi:hypothetical protein